MNRYRIGTVGSYSYSRAHKLTDGKLHRDWIDDDPGKSDVFVSLSEKAIELPEGTIPLGVDPGDRNNPIEFYFLFPEESVVTTKNKGG